MQGIRRIVNTYRRSGIATGAVAAVPGQIYAAFKSIWFLVPRRSSLFMLAWLAGLTTFFAAATTVNLANYRPVSGDDAWILSASYKLATQGVFGSDMYAGFFNADQHYFIALPGQHLLQALALWVSGDGLVAARWTSVLGGGLLLWSVTLMAWRWYGTPVATLTSVLLLFWQPALVGHEGVPLVSLARSLRYDLTAVAWTWLALLFLDALLRRPARLRAVATGCCAAAALLTQFFGAIVTAVVALAWLGQRRKQTLSSPYTRWLLSGFLLLVGPYLVYVATHRQDAWGQTVYLKGSRTAFSAQAMVDNVLREQERFNPLLEESGGGAGSLLLLLGTWPALAYLGLRLRRKDNLGDRLLALTLVCTPVLLTIFETTKAPIYALPLLPALCVSLALPLGRLLEAAFVRPAAGAWLPRRAAAIAVLAVMALIVDHGADFYRQDRMWALNVTDYHALGATIDDALPAGAKVAGSERWWWPLRAHPFLAVNNLSLQWRIARDRGRQTPSFAALMGATGVDSLLLSRNVRGDMSRAPEALQHRFWEFVETCTILQEQWDDPWYGELSLRAVRPACSSRAAGDRQGDE